MLRLSDFKRLGKYDGNWTVSKCVFMIGVLILYQYKKSRRGEMAVLELPESTLLVVKEKPCPR